MAKRVVVTSLRQQGPFHLGKYSRAVNIVSLLVSYRIANSLSLSNFPSTSLSPVHNIHLDPLHPSHLTTRNGSQHELFNCSYWRVARLHPVCVVHVWEISFPRARQDHRC